MDTPALFKDVFNVESVSTLARLINETSPFPVEEFTALSVKSFHNQELKERSNAITAALITYLPTTFKDSGEIILNTLQSIPLTGQENWRGFILMPVGTFVEQQGLQKNDLELSFEIIYELTKRFTAEFAVRKFILKHHAYAMQKMHTWVNDENEHVRRLCSEGTRPRLPWATKIPDHIENPARTFLLLEKLMDDSSIYVQKSVANHLNDISKDNPEALCDFLLNFKSSNSMRTKWIVKHSLRTLIKKGNTEALSLLGYNDCINVQLNNLTVSNPNITLGEYLNFTFEIINNSEASENLIIDYLIHHKKSNGKLLPKVFKLKIVTLKPNESIVIQKKHSFKPISTRKYYSGEHRVQVQANGNLLDSIIFHLNA